MVVIAVLLTVAALLVADYFIRRAVAHRARLAVTDRTRTLQTVGDLDVIPADVYLSAGHVWVRLLRSGAVRVGADELPTTLLGGVDRIEIPPAGRNVRSGDPIVTLHRDGRSVQLRSPMDGVLGSVNPRISRQPQLSTSAPYDEGWMYELWPTEVASALKRMYVSEDAVKWMREELGRLRDFLAHARQGPRLAPVALADGGTPIDSLATQLSEREWSRLVARFFAPAA